MSSIDNHIRERLDGFYENNYENVSDSFLYKFGPYIAMNTGYEKQVDDIARKYHVMRFLQIGAYVLRYLKQKENLDRKVKIDFLKKLIQIELPNEFDERCYADEYHAIEKLITEKLVDLSTINRGSESVMTNIAPVVPYDSSLVGVYSSDPETDRVPTDDLGATNFAEELHRLLVKNFTKILESYKLTTYAPDKMDSIHRELVKTYGICGEFEDVAKYYRMAEAYYTVPPTGDALASMNLLYTSLFQTDEDKSMDESAFESMVNGYAANLTPGLEEDWDDMDLSDKDDEAIQSMLADAGLGTEQREDRPMFDLNALYNFIYLNRYIQFDTWSQRLFVEKFNAANRDDAKIININRINDKISAFEISTGILEVPFVDLRDYKVRVICLRRNESKPFISGDILYE